MDLENKVLLRTENRLSADDDYSDVPLEYRIQLRRFMRRRTDATDAVFSAVAVLFAVSIFAPFLLSPFAPKAVTLRASSLGAVDALGFVTFLGGMDDLSDSKKRDVFGWGGLDVIYRASEALAPHVQNCRALLQPASAEIGLTFRFDVKIDTGKPGFVVSGLLEGQDTQPDVATCLRDRINTLQIFDFGKLRTAHPKSYRLQLGVQLSHGSDGGAP